MANISDLRDVFQTQLLRLLPEHDQDQAFAYLWSTVLLAWLYGVLLPAISFCNSRWLRVRQARRTLKAAQHGDIPIDASNLLWRCSRAVFYIGSGMKVFGRAVISGHESCLQCALSPWLAVLMTWIIIWEPLRMCWILVIRNRCIHHTRLVRTVDKALPPSTAISNTLLDAAHLGVNYVLRMALGFSATPGEMACVNMGVPVNLQETAAYSVGESAILLLLYPGAAEHVGLVYPLLLVHRVYLFHVQITYNLGLGSSVLPRTPAMLAAESFAHKSLIVYTVVGLLSTTAVLCLRYWGAEYRARKQLAALAVTR